MTLSKLSSKHWTKMVAPPKLSDKEWANVNVVGLVLLVMAAAQLVGFSEFKNWFAQVDMRDGTAWATGLIIAEVWAALSFSKARLSSAFRLVGHGIAIVVSGFWFVENLQLVSGGAAGQLNSSGYFGKYLLQSPGWWTIIEASVLLLWTLYAVNVLKNK